MSTVAATSAIGAGGAGGEGQDAVAASRDVRISFKEKLIFSLAGGERVDSVAIDRQMRAMHIERPRAAFCVVGFYVDYDERRLQSEDETAARAWRFEAIRAIEDYLRESQCADEVYPYERYILLLHETRGEALLPGYRDMLGRIAAMMNETMRVHVSMCQSRPCADFFRMSASLEELRAQRLFEIAR